MAFCSKCGNQILDNAKFCPKCGTPVATSVNNEETRMYQQPAQQPYQQPYQQPVQPSNGKNNQTLLYAVIGALALLIIGGCIYYFVSKNDQKMEEMNQKMETLETQNKVMKEKAKEAEEEAKKKAEEAEEEAKKAEEAKKEAETVKTQKTIVNEGAVHGAQHMAASSGKKVNVVINGVGVRLRFAPSLSAGYLTDANGRNRSVPKGTKLKWTGYDDGDWYEVEYLGNYFYVSKQFSYLEY